MKILHIKQLKDGRRHVLVELAVGEKQPLAAFNQDGYYQVGYPVEDILPGYVLNDTKPAAWDCIAQKWDV